MKLAVLGLGFMGSTHLKALRSVPGATLAAVFSHDDRKISGDLSAVQGNLGGPGERFDFSAVAQYRELDALLADPAIDAVDICLPTDLHEPVAVAALRAGKHVLVEKPMALDGAAAERMIDEATHQGRILMTAQVLRFMGPYLALEEALGLPDVGTDAKRHVPAAMRGAGVGRVVERSWQERRRRIRSADPRCGHVPASFRETGSRGGNRIRGSIQGNRWSAGRALLRRWRRGDGNRRLAAFGSLSVFHGVQRHTGWRGD